MRGAISTKAKAGYSHDGPGAAACRTPEGRVSIARWNPKGMRRSAGLQSMGTIPKMNRSAKGGARSSLHFRDEGVLIHPPHQGDCGQHGTEEQRVTSGGRGRWQAKAGRKRRAARRVRMMKVDQFA